MPVLTVTAPKVLVLERRIVPPSVLMFAPRIVMSRSLSLLVMLRTQGCDPMILWFQLRKLLDTPRQMLQEMLDLAIKEDGENAPVTR